MNDNLLKVEDIKIEFISKSNSFTAVENVSFSLNSGEILGIVGESGSGKTLSAMSILQLLPKNAKVTQGNIYFKGQDLTSLSEKEMENIRGNNISMIFQDPIMSLDQIFTVGDQIIEAIVTHKDISKEDAKSLAIDLLGQVEISNPERIFDAYPFELSGGMCQRVMIAIALSCNPDLIIADEPTTALDVTIQAQIMDLLKKIKSENNTSIILITHDLGVVSEMCESIVVMYAGTIMENSSKENIFLNSKHPYTMGLLKSVPRLGQKKEKLYSIRGAVPDLKEISKGCRFSNRCDFAEEICFNNEPNLIKVGENHFSRCHFFDKL